MHAGPGCPFQQRRLRYDGAFRTEVAYCAEHGIPHSEFLARWSNEDRAKLVAHLVEQSEKCSMCGTADWQWIEDPEAFTPVFHDCMGCYLKETFRRSAPDADNRPGRTVTLKSKLEVLRGQFGPGARIGPRLKKRTRRRKTE